LLRRGIEASSIETLDDVRPSVKASELFGSSDGEVRVRAGVIVIPGGMFRGSNWVRGLTFEPECQVGMIDEYSFYGTGLRSVDIPASVEVIGDASFANCTLLASVRFESDRRLRVIGEDAFWGIAIQSVEIPGSVRIVGEWSFAWRRRLRRVALPGSDSESRVGACAFAFTPYRSQSNPGGGVAPSIRRCSSHETLTELKSRFDRLGKPRCDPCSALLYSKALELAHAKRHSDAFKMYIRAMYAVEKGDQGIILRIMVVGGMETFASLPDINGRVIDRWSGFFSWLRTRIMCPASRSATIELHSMAEATDETGDAGHLRRKGVFLELLGDFWDDY
jgi:hypothetical protein